MSELRICRICLDSNVQMHLISGSEVQDVYKKLTNTQVQDEGNLYFACYLCYCQLKKCQHLVIKSQQSQESLKQILEIHNELNLKSVHSVDRLSYGLVTSLMISDKVSLQIPDSHENIKCEDRSESDTDEMMFKDEPEDDCTFANEERWEGDGKQKVMQDEAKSIEDIYEILSNIVSKEKVSFKQVLVTNNKQYFICNDCGKKCDTKAHLIKHISYNNCNIKNTKTKRIKKEKYVYKGNIKYNNTLNKGMPTRGKPYKCEYCNFSFTKIGRLNSHVRKHKGEKPFKCEYCNYSCTSSYRLNTHVRTHTGEKPFKCEYCNYTCANKYYLKDHIKTHTEEKSFKCEYCKFSSRFRGSLKIHVRTHTGEKPYKCEYCNYSCTHSGRLNIHVRTHTGEKPFKCEYCNLTFASTSYLKGHIKTHTGEKPFKCEYCNYTSIRSYLLKQHIKKHTGEKLFKCEYCNYKCTSNSHLKQHIRTHTGEKPCKCEYCNYSCTNSGRLNIHVRMHTGEKPYKCEYCNYSCTCSASLNKHIRTHTRDKSFKCK